MSAVFAMRATRPLYLRLRKDCGSAANRRWGPEHEVAALQPAARGREPRGL